MKFFLLFLLFLFNNNFCFSFNADSTLIDEKFNYKLKEWQQLYLIKKSKSNNEKCFIKNNKLYVSGKNNYGYGIYYVKSFKGNFYLQVECNLIKGSVAGIMLLKEKNGIPDVYNYLTIEKAINDKGGGKIFVYKVENSVKKAISEYKVDQDIKVLKILRDANASCFHFYYQYKKYIDNKYCSGWKEFPTIEDWNNTAFFVYLYIKSNNNGETVSEFDNLIVRQTSIKDISDENTGFKASKRDYTFSGFTGKAIVVTFGKEFSFYKTAKFIFWDEANYIPWWHIDSETAVTYEFVETWGGGTKGCCEPMSDRFLRWSKVDIVEVSKVRIIVHWKYVLANYLYQWWGRNPYLKPYVDEYYCFYPDGIGVRKIVFHNIVGITRNEVSELIVVNGSGSLPSDHLYNTALTVMNINGDSSDYTWDIPFAKQYEEFNKSTKYWNEIICRVNLKNRPGVFEVFAQSDETKNKTFPTAPIQIDTWELSKDGYGAYEFKGDFNAFSHWPISKRPYENPSWSAGRYIREVSHTCLLSIGAGNSPKDETIWSMLIGLSPPFDDFYIRNIVKSWLYPGKIKMLDNNSVFIENNYYRRALVFDNVKRNQKCYFSINPYSKASVIINPVFVIKNWGDYPIVVYMNKNILPPNKVVYEIIDENAVLWIKTKFDSLTTFMINKS